MQIEHFMRRSFDNFNNLSNLSKFNNLSYLHFSLCAPMSSADLIHLSFLLNFFLFSFVVCCVRWDVTCRNIKAFCIYRVIKLESSPTPFFFRSQAAEQFLLVLQYRPQTSRFSSPCSLHAFRFTLISQICRAFGIMFHMNALALKSEHQDKGLIKELPGNKYHGNSLNGNLILYCLLNWVKLMTLVFTQLTFHTVAWIDHSR